MRLRFIETTVFIFSLVVWLAVGTKVLAQQNPNPPQNLEELKKRELEYYDKIKNLPIDPSANLSPKDQEALKKVMGIFGNAKCEVKVAWPDDVPLYPGSVAVDKNLPFSCCIQNICGVESIIKSPGEDRERLKWYEDNLLQHGWVKVTGDAEKKWKEETLGHISAGGFTIDTDKIMLMGKREGGKCYSFVIALQSAPGPGVTSLGDLVGKMGIDDQLCLLAMGSGDNGNNEGEKMCKYSLELEQERQKIFERLKQQFGLRIADSNRCEDKTACGNNSLWSENELLDMEKTFDKISGCFLDTAKKRLVDIRGRIGGELFSSIQDNACCAGIAQSGVCAYYLFLEQRINICGRRCVEKGNTIEEMLVHELTHAFQDAGATAENLPGSSYTNPIVISWLRATGWSPDGVCLPIIGCPGTTIALPSDLPSKYAQDTRNPLEDMAESVRLYVTNPKELLSVSPRRYNFVRDNIMCGKEYQ